MSDDVLYARALLNRLAEPANVPLWDLVRQVGPVETVELIRAQTAPADVLAAVAPRVAAADPLADLAAADRHGVRLLVPESEEWPHFAFSALEHTGVERVDSWNAGHKRHAESGEEVPPLALWAKGPLDASTLSVRSVGIVGARASTDYGNTVAREFASALTQVDFCVVSGGAYGIDAAAHVGALRAGGITVAVSAGGLDRAYPVGNSTLFDRIAETGLLLSESPPGSAPQRRRFLTRNRLIAALSTGTVLVEAAARSGALNTIGHCVHQGRQIMAVPGPITSHVSRGCHDVLARMNDRAALVTSARDVIELIGASSDLQSTAGRTDDAKGAGTLRARLDRVDEITRSVFDGFPASRSISIDELIAVTGIPLSQILGALPMLELEGIVERVEDGFRVAAGLIVGRR